jgi:hypothetical protein
MVLPPKDIDIDVSGPRASKNLEPSLSRARIFGLASTGAAPALSELVTVPVEVLAESC